MEQRYHMNLIQKIMSVFNPMLSCEQVNQFIIDYLEGKLPPKTRSKFDAHISMCKNCGAYFEQYNQTVTMVNENGQLEIPDDLAKLTLEFLQEHLPQDS